MNSLSSSQLSIERSQRQRLWNGNKIKDKNPSELFVKSSFLCDGFFYNSPFILWQKLNKDCTFAAIRHVRHRKLDTLRSWFILKPLYKLIKSNWMYFLTPSLVQIFFVNVACTVREEKNQLLRNKWKQLKYVLSLLKPAVKQQHVKSLGIY